MSETPLFRLMNDHFITLAGKEYPMTLVKDIELRELRLSGKTGVVMTELKDGERLIWCALVDNKNIKLTSSKWMDHKCCNERDCCTRLSAAKDPDGCACIRDEPISDCIAEGYSRKQAYRIGFRVEKYNFINCAVQTFGMKDNSYKILICQNCTYSTNKKKEKSENEMKNSVLGLAQYLNPTIKSYDEIDKKLRRYELPEVSD